MAQDPHWGLVRDYVPERWLYGAVAIRHDPAMKAHHPSASESPVNFWASQVNSGAGA